jgi:hypothetical protein
LCSVAACDSGEESDEHQGAANPGHCLPSARQVTAVGYHKYEAEYRRDERAN